MPSQEWMEIQAQGKSKETSCYNLYSLATFKHKLKHILGDIVGWCVMANTRDKLVLTNNKHFISLNRGFLGRILDHVRMYLFVFICIYVFFRLTCGIIARSAGLFQNSKKFCACDGKILWEDKPLSTPTSPPSQLWWHFCFIATQWKKQNKDLK